MLLFTRKRSAGAPESTKGSPADINNALIEEIAQAKQEIDDAFNHFQNVSDPDLIDCCIYKGNAAQIRYGFLLRQAK